MLDTEMYDRGKKKGNMLCLFLSCRLNLRMLMMMINHILHARPGMNTRSHETHIFSKYCQHIL